MRALLAAVVLLATLVAQSTAQLSFGPVFHLNAYETSEERQQVVVRLSAPILARNFVPDFNGTIVVTIKCGDLTDGDSRRKANFGTDYIVDTEDPQSMTFVVVFVSNRAQSTEHVILIADDAIFEGTEFFRCQIVKLDFTEGAQQLFRPQDRINSTFADVRIEDNDIVRINWTKSEAISVNEGGPMNATVTVKLSAQAFGFYANEIALGIDCSETIATEVEPALPNKDFIFTEGTKLHFRDTNEATSFSFDEVVITIVNDDIAEPRESFICSLQAGNVDAIQAIFPNQVTIEIRDNDELVVRWAEPNYEFVEGDISARVELVIDSKFEAERVSIQGMPSQIPDRHPTRIPSLMVPGPSIPGLGFQVRASIERVSVSVMEFGNAQVTQAGRTDVERTMNDFVFTTNRSSAFESFNIVPDDVLEFNEYFIAEFEFGPDLLQNWNTRKGMPSTTFILIVDDDFVEVNFNLDSYSFKENAGQVSITLRITGQLYIPVYAIVEFHNGTATDTEDYSTARQYNVTFPLTALTDQDNPNLSTESVSIPINITDDNIFEGLEYFQAKIVKTSDPIRVRIGRDTVNVTIMDDDNVTVRYENETYTVEEEAGVVTLALVLEGEAVIPVTVSVNTLDLLDDSVGDDATAVMDYLPKSSFDITFPTGSKRQVYNITIEDDSFLENSEYFNTDVTARPEDASRVLIGSPKQPFIEILDNDNVTVCYENETYSVEEEAGVVTLALVLKGHAAIPVTVSVITRDLTNSSVGDAATAVLDYLPRTPFNVTFPAGSKRQLYDVIIVDDIFPENSEYFNADVNARPEDISRVFIESPDMPFIEIKDNVDQEVEILLDQTAYSIFENETIVTVTLRLSNAYREDIAVNVAVGELAGIDALFRAQADVDFSTAGFPQVVTILAGQTSVQFTVIVIDELIVEKDELFQLSLIYTEGQPGVDIRTGFDKANITIKNDDDVTVRYENETYCVEEEAGVVTLALVLEGDAAIPVTVSVITRDLTNSSVGDAATAVLDYLPRTPFNVTFPAGSKRQLYDVIIVDDIFPENSEYFNADVNARPEDISRVFIESPDMPFIEIKDNVDQEVEILLDQTAYSIFENETIVTVTLRLSNAYREDIAVNVAVSELAGIDALFRAQADVDFSTAGFPQVVTIPAGQTSVQFTVTVIDELIVEKDELFQLSLIYTEGQPGVDIRTGFDKANITIKNDDVLTVMFNPADYEVPEGEAVQLFLVTDNPYSFNFTINVTTQDGSAVSPADYNGSSFIASFAPSLDFPGLSSVVVSTHPDNVLEGLEYFNAVLSVPAEFPDVLEGVPNVARVNITDATIAGVFFDPEAYMVPEGENVTLILKTNVTVNKRFGVLVNTADDSANSPSDYQGGEKQAIFEIGSNTATVQYTTAEDGIQEGLETFTAELTVPPDMQAMGIFAGMPDTAMVHIVDDDNLTCMLVRTMHEVREDEGGLNVTVMCSVPSEDLFTLLVRSTDGTAIEGEDYIGREFFVMFPPGSTKDSFTVPIINDDVFESDEMFSLTLEIPQPAQDAGVMRGVPFMATVTIINDELPVVIDIEQRVIDVIESQKQVEVCLVKNGTSSRPIMAFVGAQEIMDVAGSPGSMGALDEEDFESEPNVSSIVMMGSETKKCANITIIDDKTVEMMEPFEFIITFPPGQEAIDSGEIVPAAMQLTGTINIIDDDEITVQFAQDMYMVRESDGVVDVMVVASNRTSFSYMFTVTPMDITATNDVDYVFSSTVYEFLPADANEPIPSTVISIPIIPDEINEFDETFKLTIVVSDEARASNISEGEINMTLVLIKDDDNVTVSFSPQNYTVPEGIAADLMIVLDKPSVNNITITVTTMDITAQSDADYTGGSFNVVIPAGTIKVTVPVATLDDNLLEDDEFFKATLTIPGAPADVVVGSPNMAFVNITDGDSIIPVRFNPAAYSVTEGVDSNAVITLEALEDHPDFAFTVTVITQDGTATRGSDYEGERFTVTFPAGVNVISFNVTIINDNIAECAELFTLDLEIPAASADMGVIKGSPDTATVNITDDEVVVVSFSPQNYSVLEGTPADIMIVLDQLSPKNITVNVTTMDITAQDPDDYTGDSFTVLIPAGTMKETLGVNTVADNLVEGDEFFKATLSLPGAPEAVEVGTPNMAFVNITDDDVNIPVRFNPSNYSVKEGVDSNAVITLEALADHPNSAFTVTVLTQDGTATRDSDYEGERFTVTFPAGVNVISFNVTIIDDNIAECAELFTLDLEIPAASAALGVMKGSPDTATVNIMDDDVEELMISLDSNEYSVREDVGTLMAAVTATGPAEFPYTVTVDSVDGTAVEGADYQLVDLQLEFLPGEERVEFNITIVDDKVMEDPEEESFLLALSISDDITSKGVQLGPNARATVTITDNDVLVKFSQEVVSVTEDDGQAPVTVVAMGDLSSPFSVIVMAMNGTAYENTDFTGNMWRVDFPAGFTDRGFMIPIIRDGVSENTEEFSLKIVIESPFDQRVSVGEPSMQRVLITDIDNDTVRGDPLFSIPLPSKYLTDPDLKSIQLCFEVHGISGNHYNLISDNCTSVSARYSQGVSDAKLNVITEMGIKSQGGNGTCHTIEVDLTQCRAYLDGVFRNITSTISVNGIAMTIRRKHVRVSLPNCHSSRKLILWMMCMMRNSEDMMELVVARGDGLEPTAHGLIGQFWNIPLTIAPYVGPYGDGSVVKSDRKYIVTASYPGARNRTFIADYGKRDWQDNRHCLYAGNRNAGPSGEVKGYGSVIEGKAGDYVVAGLFSTDFTFSKYNGNC